MKHNEWECGCCGMFNSTTVSHCECCRLGGCNNKFSFRAGPLTEEDLNYINETFGLKE